MGGGFPLRERSSGRTALIIACGVLTALLAPALFGRAVLGFRDMLHNYGPMRHLFWSGAVTLWNDRAFGGGAILPDLVQQPFYLGNLLFRLVHAPEQPLLSISGPTSSSARGRPTRWLVDSPRNRPRRWVPHRMPCVASPLRTSRTRNGLALRLGHRRCLSRRISGSSKEGLPVRRWSDCRCRRPS